MRRIPYFLVSILILTILFGCSSDYLDFKKVNNRESGKTLIISAIVGKGTPYKQEIANKLVEKLKDRFTIEVMNLRSASDLERKEYDAIVIMDSCEAWMFFNSRIKRIMKALPAEKQIIVVTAEDQEFEWTYNGLDAITGASTDDDSDKIAERILAQIDKKFPPKRPRY